MDKKKKKEKEGGREGREGGENDNSWGGNCYIDIKDDNNDGGGGEIFWAVKIMS